MCNHNNLKGEKPQKRRNKNPHKNKKSGNIFQRIKNNKQLCKICKFIWIIKRFIFKLVIFIFELINMIKFVLSIFYLN